ncbi:histidine kinase [Nonomuraea sp. NPDC050556]|uniref:sensor histidine kinase n=1 Tax=Nonomuraea sp. NPDC050556 TaxID=3364369 RepID=UPI00378B9569
MKLPWSARAWLDTAHVVTGLVVSTITGFLTIVLIVWPGLWRRAVSLFTRVQRSRFAAFQGVDIPSAPYSRRQAVYHLFSVFLGLAGTLVTCMAWAAALILTLSFLLPVAFPPPIVFAFDYRSPIVLSVAVASGLVLLLVTPWIARGFATLDLAMATALLGPSRVELTQRIETLRESRAGAVDAADAERRRIERDLHDGAQQRLVSLAMNLGLARATITDLSEPAAEALAQAHDEAKLALKELRDFVRGLHPAVLNDEGLDAALSGIAARAPLPVQLRVDVGGRISPTIEAVAFFVVSEALTNISKHAEATSAEIVVQRSGDRLRLMVFDDGKGGAALDGGTGLRGLSQRIASVDGVLHIESPDGGPTRIKVELPCE